MKKGTSSNIYKTDVFTILFLSLLCFSCSRTKVNNDPYFFYVNIDTVNSTEIKCVKVDCDFIKNHFGEIELNNIEVKDLDNDNIMVTSMVDTNNDGKAEFLFFDIDFNKESKLKTYKVSINNNKPKKLTFNNDCKCTSFLNTIELFPVNSINKDTSEGKWSEYIAKSVINTYPDACKLEFYSPGEWSYTNGFMINALCELGAQTNNKSYFDYSKQWIDCFVDSLGNIDTSAYEINKFELDNILPGRSLIFLYQKTGHKRYKKAADQLIYQLCEQPMTSDSGFWHKNVYAHQMWLDGIYMGDVFLAQYGHEFNKPQYIDRAIQQVILIYSHTYDANTDLLFHGWDESKSKVWANNQTGASPEIWGRSMGWFMMALVDMLDYIPNTHQKRNELLKIFRSLSETLLKYQDHNGLWFQVVDKKGLIGNWHETSCSAMIGYAFAKGSKNGYLGPKFMNYAKETFNGLKDNYIYLDKENRIYLTGTVKVGTLNTKYSDGSYNYYISVERRLNDFKGLASLLYLSMYLK